MTPYIKNQLIKLCDHPEWFNDMLISLDNNPEEPHTAIRNYLSHVQLNGLLENTEIVHVSFNGDEPKPGFYFEIPKDPNMYLILGILDEEAYLTKKFIYRMNLIIILLVYTGIPNRINTHKVPGIYSRYLPHYPTQK